MKKGPMGEKAQENSHQADFVIRHSRIWDRFGIFTSGLCLIHCLATPLALILYPAFVAEHHHTHLHVILLPLVISIASISFYTSYLRHKNHGPILTGSLGVCLLAISLIFFHQAMGWGLALTILGSAIVLASHIWNIRACHCFCEPNCADHDHDHDHDH